ncbi:1,4-dihydroxy-2-naphthoate polyprenyltransferase [Natronobacterium gregoryi]|uniref:1,4-dihydroxy-2-naphthoate octaprenyltransferase n=2 Tax=Natronobacterium gregoryi TaxID=44930 RepID=L0AC77_NATGS|nr:1,4-dihydroxy-2-naphthoate polyprenyltransferase [Natronobacterium gregoryi]AFZ71471.1 1,4-dihydroxy-2-naphthoate octaprenyltransferase [Natronobacterium gregoryi SP2]ELY66773.1 1,4-dihydroxy-2-naphthoate octaprenyltransferase [Natronobacterium gregoryi SP2]PLK19935.1 1,4-dihydroxy-2-naphthoate polyprenyltransferase [Natronobacterium gregoryi SP2]SFJ36488.1 1,4-dihydroxy-2-naphthoate prenyltransferase [Natronobacterium gregoryi]
MTEVETSRTKAWLMAARPQTLPAAAAPVIVGTGLAIHEGVFAPWPALLAFVGAALIQIGTNFANDYYDAVKGTDTEDREGFTRVTQAGIISPGQVKFATIVTFALAILSGTYLVYVGGVPILVIGLVSVLCGWAYTGGPYPLGYHGLGDLFVFVFFGIVAVMGTFYVQAAAVLLAQPFPVSVPEGTVTVEAFVASLPVASISTCIIIVNNVRDKETDAETGKRTLAVRLGYRWSRVEFVALLALAYLAPLWFWPVSGEFGPAVLLPLVTLPYAAIITRTVCTRTDGEALNPALEATGKLLALYAALFAAGLSL